MRLVSLRPYYFRAFQDGWELPFSEQLTLFFGTNGAGKSSLAEALEWLLLGYTTRRQKGDTYSKNEYKGSYVNHRWQPSNEPPSVTLKVRSSDGQTHILRRQMLPATKGKIDDTQSQLSVDGSPVRQLSDMGFRFTTAQSPIVVQHGIQDIIHTRPD